MRIWVIGGLSGIGLATAKVLRNQNHIVKSTGQELDVRNYEQLNKFSSNNFFDVIIYSAGVNTLSFISDIEDTKMQDQFDVNVIGFINVLKALTNNQDNGKIICVVSSAADIAMRGSIAYCASKAALKMAVKCAARELAPNWSVVGISPGVVDNTAMSNYVDKEVLKLRGWTAEEAKQYELSSIPMSRRCTVNECSDAILHIMNIDEYLSGSIIDFALESYTPIMPSFKNTTHTVILHPCLAT